MHTKKLTVSLKRKDETIKDYSALGYELAFCAEKDGEVRLTFNRKEKIPHISELKKLERKYNFLKARRFFFAYPFAIGAIALGILGNMFTGNTKILIYAGMIVCILICVADLSTAIATMYNFDALKRDILEEGEELQNLHRYLPKDGFVRNDLPTAEAIKIYFKTIEDEL